MKISVIISVKDRVKLFKRSLKSLCKQTLTNNEFEIVVIDDNSSENILELLESFQNKLNIKYIKINSELGESPIFWGPSLSNNIGFKNCNGEVIIIAGPEILHKENNLKYLYQSAINDEAVYGHVLHSNSRFVSLMDNNLQMEDYSFDRLFSIPYARVMDITKNTFYWFICAAKKEAVMAINGCDEEFMKGICGDDDDFINRIEAYGLKRTHNYKVIGIHQDHSVEDRSDTKRIRRTAIWEEARIRNTKYLIEWETKRNKDPIANKNKDWGSNKYIISNILLGK